MLAPSSSLLALYPMVREKLSQPDLEGLASSLLQTSQQQTLGAASTQDRVPMHHLIHVTAKPTTKLLLVLSMIDWRQTQSTYSRICINNFQTLLPRTRNRKQESHELHDRHRQQAQRIISTRIGTRWEQTTYYSDGTSLKQIGLLEVCLGNPQ